MEKMSQDQEERLSQNLQELAAADRDFARKQAQAELEREEQLEELREQGGDAARQYWTWLHKTKRNIEFRPCSAPPPCKSEVESIESRVQTKIDLAAREDKERKTKYEEWLRNVSKAKFTLPDQEVLTPQQREQKIAEMAKKRRQNSAKAATEYKKFVVDMKQRLQERVRDNVKSRLECERRHRRDVAERAAVRQENAAQMAEQAEMVAQQHEQFVAEVYSRVRSTPFMVEEAYIPKDFIKVPSHRRPTSAPLGRRARR